MEMKNYSNVTIFDHPLIKHKVAILRNEKTTICCYEKKYIPHRGDLHLAVHGLPHRLHHDRGKRGAPRDWHNV